MVVVVSKCVPFIFSIDASNRSYSREHTLLLNLRRALGTSARRRTFRAVREGPASRQRVWFSEYRAVAGMRG